MSTQQQQLETDVCVEDNSPTLEREWAMPNKWTFDVPPIRTFVENAIDTNDGLWIDPFAGTCHLADVTNDIDPEQDTDCTLKARAFLQQFDDGEVDGGVILDPPYSPRQIKESYNSVGLTPSQYETGSGWMRDIRDAVARIVNGGTTVLTFGWNSTGIGKTRGFTKQQILFVCHGGSHHDTICVQERYEP